MDATQKVVTKKKKTRFFETYISKVLKQVSEKNGITANSKQQLNSALCLVSRLISTQVISLTEIAKKKTMSEKEVKNALRVLLPGELATRAITAGQKAVDTFGSVQTTSGTSRQEKAGIVFPPAIAEKFLRNFGYSKVMLTSQAPVCLAGALEYLTSEILENASISAKDSKRIRLTIRDLELAIRSDDEMGAFFTSNKISFLGGGVVPFIHPSLQIKKNRKKRAKRVTKDGEKKKHRFRPGTVSLREIRRFQKLSNCLTFAKFPFEKVVRSVVSDHHDSETKMKISKEVFIVLQYVVEQQIVTLLRNANFAAIHAGRVKLMPIDINFVRAVSTGDRNPHQKTIENSEVLSVEAETQEDLVDIEEEEEEELVEEEEEEEEEELIEEE